MFRPLSVYPNSGGEGDEQFMEQSVWSAPMERSLLNLSEKTLPQDIKLIVFSYRSVDESYQLLKLVTISKSSEIPFCVFFVFIVLKLVARNWADAVKR